MSNKKKRKHRLNAAKLHKAASREHVGQVPPTKVLGDRRKSRGGGGRRRFDNITLDGVPLGEFMSVSESMEQVPTVPSSLSVRPYVPSSSVKPKYSFRTRAAESPYSEEVRVHFEFLLKSQGDKVAHEYLNALRNGEMTENNLTLGPVENAIKDADEKVRFYTHQALVAEQEATRWRLVKEQLQGALDLATGKKKPEIGGVTTFAERATSTRTRTDWPPLIVKVLTDNPNGLTRGDLKDKLSMEVPEVNQTTIYGAIKTAERNSVVIFLGDRYYLQSQLESQTGVKP